MRLPFTHHRRCELTPYASQLGALKASLQNATVPTAHHCEHCPNTWHTGPAPAPVKAVAA